MRKKSKEGRYSEQENQIMPYLTVVKGTCTTKSDTANNPSWKLFKVSTCINETLLICFNLFSFIYIDIIKTDLAVFCSALCDEIGIDFIDLRFIRI